MAVAVGVMPGMAGKELGMRPEGIGSVVGMAQPVADVVVVVVAVG